MAKINLYGELYYVQSNKVLGMCMDAKPLPPCISWHPGLCLDIGENIWEVDYVTYAYDSGEISVSLKRETLHGAWGADERRGWESDGWTVLEPIAADEAATQ